MRFFDHQEAARSQSRRLLVLFALATAATVLGVHLALELAWWALEAVLGPIGKPALWTEVNLGVPLVAILGGWWLEAGQLRGPQALQRLAQRMGAQPVRAGRGPQEQVLGNIVDELSIAAHMPRPEVMVLPRMQAINAMAAGIGDSGLLMVSQGALDSLERDELQGLVAHEFSHLREGDTALHLRLAGMVGGLELLWRWGEHLREVRVGLVSVIGTIIMAVGVFGWWAGRAMQAAVSRQRELLADARAVQWTRNREGLGRVLRKALGQRQDPGAAWRDPSWDAAFRHFLLVAPPREAAGWFDTHPPLAERIRRIYGRSMPALDPAAAQRVGEPQPAGE